MLKLRKEKLLVSLIVILMIVLAIGNVTSLATSTQITATTNSALSSNNSTNIGATESVTATGNNTNKSNNTANTNKTNTNNTNKSNTNRVGNSLPYAGTNGTIIFVVIALAASAVYAYKKVSDYNI